MNPVGEEPEPDEENQVFNKLVVEFYGGPQHGRRQVIELTGDANYLEELTRACVATDWGFYLPEVRTFDEEETNAEHRAIVDLGLVDVWDYQRIMWESTTRAA